MIKFTILIFLLIASTMFVSGCMTNSNNVNSAIIIHDSGSTNTNGFDLTVSSNGSGVMIVYSKRSQTNLSSKQYPAGTLDYKSLQQSIEAVPDITIEGQCAKSASFGTVETVSYNGKVSGDITCPVGATGQNLVNAVVEVLTQANCFDNNSTDCLEYRDMEASGIDSGIKGYVSVSPIPGCIEPPNLKSGEYNPCGVSSLTANFTITKPDGTLVTQISTDKDGNFYALLQPGNYVLNDITAGSSSSPHKFYDANNPSSKMSDQSISYNFTVNQHAFTYIGPWFDGNSFSQ